MASVGSLSDGLANAGCEVRFWRCPDERAEAAAVAAEIERLIYREQVEPCSVAVLTPALPARRAIAGALSERAIPHRMQGPLALLRRSEVRDVLAWMRLLLDRDDAGAAARALLAPPIEMRHVDLAQVVQIARRRRLDVVSALPPSIESPQVPPEARERMQRFLALHRDLEEALRELRPRQFIGRLIERTGLRRGRPLTGELELADLASSLAWLQEIADSFERSYPWAGAKQLAAHLLSLSEAGAAVANIGEAATGEAATGEAATGEAATSEASTGAVQLLGLRAACEQPIAYAFLLGLHARALREDGEGVAAIVESLQEGCRRVVLCCPEALEGGEPCALSPAVERMRSAVDGSWEQIAPQQAGPEEMIEAALRTMRQELLDGVSSIGARLGELRLDTDVDISHGIVRYLELVKLAALLERPPGQGVAEALDDVNSRLQAAVTPLQREILESSTLDEELLAGRAAGGQQGAALGRLAAGEPSLQRFLPRKGDGLLLSASDIETYRSCPLRYKFARVLRIPTEPTRNQRFGIAVHQVLERYHSSGGQTEAQLLELLDACWRRGGFGEGGEDRILREKAEGALRRYHERLAGQESEPVWFERSFSFALGRHRVRGRVDRVDRLPDGGHELIDYKTGRPKSEEQLRQDIQLSLYALAAKESWQITGTRQSYYHLLDDVKVPLPDGGASSEWVREVAAEVGEAILQERFEPTPSKASCSLCDYRIVCPVAEG